MCDVSSMETDIVNDNNKECAAENAIKNDNLSKDIKNLDNNSPCERKLETKKSDEGLTEESILSQHDTECKIKPETNSTNKQKLKDVPIDKIDSVSSQSTNSEFSEEHITYTDDGIAIYTCPKTNYKYKWSAKEEKWVSLEEQPENEHYSWCTDTKQWKPKNPETEHYKWNAETNSWELKATENSTANNDANTDGNASSESVTYGVDENGHRTYTDKDGAVFFWDTSKKAWFPKID
ncbi:uncharacterized protein LOC119677841, partial [Teleopsis dalmanni]|uniref:uncharacterized protein LOC119677841 n=1 Tax=Teleopsis dalmanni TaxID=139649 RepID=UPI0018CCF8C4